MGVWGWPRAVPLELEAPRLGWEAGRALAGEPRLEAWPRALESPPGTPHWSCRPAWSWRLRGCLCGLALAPCRRRWRGERPFHGEGRRPRHGGGQRRRRSWRGLRRYRRDPALPLLCLPALSEILLESLRLFGREAQLLLHSREPAVELVQLLLDARDFLDQFRPLAGRLPALHPGHYGQDEGNCGHHDPEASEEG